MLWGKTGYTKAKRKWARSSAWSRCATTGPPAPLEGCGCPQCWRGTLLREVKNTVPSTRVSGESEGFSNFGGHPSEESPDLIGWQLQCHIMQHPVLYLIQGGCWGQYHSKYKGCRSFYYLSQIGSLMCKDRDWCNIQVTNFTAYSLGTAWISQLCCYNKQSQMLQLQLQRLFLWSGLKKTCALKLASWLLHYRSMLKDKSVFGHAILMAKRK